MQSHRCCFESGPHALYMSTNAMHERSKAVEQNLKILHMGGHDIHLIKCLGAIRALSHAVADSVFHTIVAEKMTTGLQNCVLEVFPTDGAKRESLQLSVLI
jgi:hypothetical protein